MPFLKEFLTVCYSLKVTLAAAAWSLRVRPSVTPQTTARQAPPSMGFFRQEDWSGLPFPSPKVTLNIG